MIMKKGISILLLIAAALSLASYGGTMSAQATPQPTTAPTAVETAAPANEETSSSGESAATAAEESAEGSRVLIVYFSPANADSVDAVSGATPRVGDASSVEYIAQIIGGKVDAETAKIVPTDPYPIVYDDTANRAKSEQDQDARPAFELDINPEDYDVIFIGYPVWWYHLPMIMRSFFDSYDFGGKTIIPFNTHAGSRDGGTYREIAALEPDASVLDGIAVAGERASDAEKDVLTWLAGLRY